MWKHLHIWCQKWKKRKRSCRSFHLRSVREQDGTNFDLLYKPFTSAPTELLQHHLQYQLLAPLHSQSGRETPRGRDGSLWRNYTGFSPISEVWWRTVSTSGCRPFRRSCWLGFCERGWRLEFLGELCLAHSCGRGPSLCVPLPLTLSKCITNSGRMPSGFWAVRMLLWVMDLVKDLIGTICQFLCLFRMDIVDAKKA